jgi:site-specific DNA recombinase
MKAPSIKSVRCAIYTRVSAEHGLNQEFKDAQYEAAPAYIKSRADAGWTLIRFRYDDGGYSGGSTERRLQLLGALDRVVTGLGAISSKAA